MNDLIKIGLDKRNGTLSPDMTWEEIGQMFGLTGEKVRDRVRKWVKRNQVVATPITDVKTPIGNLEILGQVEALRLERYKIQDEKSQLRKYERAYARTEMLGEYIERAIERLTPLPLIKPITFSPSLNLQQEMVVLYSDSQVGEDLISDEIDNLNDFNFEIFKERTIKYFSWVKHLALKNNIKKINLFCLGDLLEGINIYPNQKSYLEYELIDQIVLLSEFLADCINSLSNDFVIDVDYVIGNHGRASKVDAKQSTNFEYLVFKYMDSRLCRNPNVVVNHTQSFFKVKEVLGYKFLLLHGDKLKNKDSASVRLKDILVEKYGKIHYVVMGHFHEPEVTARYIVNGSIVGGNLFSLHNLQKFSDANQTCFIMRDDIGLFDTWLIPLN